MNVVRLTEPQAFIQHAGSFLLEREAEHNLMLGLAAELEHNLLVWGSQPYMAVVKDAGRVIGAALMTPPHNLILSHMEEDAALHAIAADVATFDAAPPGVLAASAQAARFAEIWCAPRGLRPQRNVAERIFQLTAVRPTRAVPGSMRVATKADRPLLVAWIGAFHAEATPHNAGATAEETAAHAEKAADRWFSSPTRTMYLWDDGEPVALAGTGGPTAHGIRIGPVYTPPEQRQRGYASALVAAASQRQLDSGRAFCFLYTDLSNPTSNHIYQEIGYQPVVDVDEIRFEE